MEPEKQKRGFACGSNARDAAAKNWKLGTARGFTTESAREAGRKGLERRWGKSDNERREPPSGALNAIVE